MGVFAVWLICLPVVKKAAKKKSPSPAPAKSPSPSPAPPPAARGSRKSGRKKTLAKIFEATMDGQSHG